MSHYLTSISFIKLTTTTPITINVTFGNNKWGAPTREGDIDLIKGQAYIFDWSNVNHSYAQGAFKIYISGSSELTEDVVIDNNAETTTIFVKNTTPSQLQYGSDAWGRSANITLVEAYVYVPTVSDDDSIHGDTFVITAPTKLNSTNHLEASATFFKATTQNYLLTNRILSTTSIF